jgi:hypothetical protein
MKKNEHNQNGTSVSEVPPTDLLGVDKDVTLLDVIKAPCELLVRSINELRKDKLRMDAIDAHRYFDENGECGWIVNRYNRGDLREEADLIFPNAKLWDDSLKGNDESK